jgi:aspartyl-tRNA(Asn)/glutamyl-tRNA(Gln) amidotransferase subunit C
VSVSVRDVEHVARLAELAVEPADLPGLAAQLDRIVGFVEQLVELGDVEQDTPFQAGPAQLRLRPDVVEPADLARPASALAPEFIDGFFVVPRLGAMSEDES